MERKKRKSNLNYICSSKFCEKREENIKVPKILRIIVKCDSLQFFMIKNLNCSALVIKGTRPTF